MRDRRPCSRCNVIQCWKHCNNCGADIMWRPPALDKSIPYTGPKPLNKADGTHHDRCYEKSKGVGPGEPDELSFSQQLFQFLISSFNPRTGRFTKPLATLAQLKVAKYNARAAPKRIEFGDAFPKRCLICDMVYQVKYYICPFCNGDIEKSDKFSNRALTKWAKSKGKRIPLMFLKYLR